MSSDLTIPRPATAHDSVELILGREHAALRRRLLEDVGPRLEAAVEGLPEDAELIPELWSILADDEAGLLDPRGAEPGAIAVGKATVAAEALASFRQTFMMPVLIATLTSAPLVLDGTPEQRERLLPRIRSGEGRAAFAMTEPDGGSDLAATVSSAVRADDGYLLNGAKSWITVAGEIDWMIVLVRQADAESATAMSLFVVESDAPGLTVTRRGDPMGMRALPLCDVDLVDVRVPKENLIGREGRAFGPVLRTLNAVRPIVGARGLGLAERVIMGAVSHAETRHSHAGTLADLPTLRSTVGDLAARLEAARLLAYRAAALIDSGHLGKEEGALLAASKLLGTELAVEAATSCMHLAGGAGYDEGLPFARCLRDAQQLTMVEGVSEVQRELVARGLLDRTMWWA